MKPACFLHHTLVSNRHSVLLYQPVSHRANFYKILCLGKTFLKIYREIEILITT